MQKLEDAKLYGNGLVEIDSPELVARYNSCLDGLGLQQTSLKRFRVDGVGWSPDIAAELSNPSYQSHGDSSPLVILLTPDQKGKPVYRPYYSYQRQLMREYWNRYDREVSDITSRAGIYVELDHGLSYHRSPADLLLMQDVVVRSIVSGNLINAFNEQRTLIAEFSNRGDAWFNHTLREAIIRSAKDHGDLRSNHFLIPEWSFTQNHYFRTSAFGGIVVLRGLEKFPNILIHESPQIEPFDLSSDTAVFYIEDKKWLTLLLEEGVLQVDTSDRKKVREDLKRLRESLLADAACLRDPELDFSGLNSAQRKSLINRLGNNLSDQYFELERIELQLESDPNFDVNKLPMDIQHMLCRPDANLSGNKKRVLAHLLSRYRPTDVWRLYRHNKVCFYEQYQTWTLSKQRWAISLIRHHLDNNLTD